MFEYIIIVIAVVLIIWASIFSWRMDNIDNTLTKKDEKTEKNFKREIVEE